MNQKFEVLKEQIFGASTTERHKSVILGATIELISKLESDIEKLANQLAQYHKISKLQLQENPQTFPENSTEYFPPHLLDLGSHHL